MPHTQPYLAVLSSFSVIGLSSITNCRVLQEKPIVHGKIPVNVESGSKWTTVKKL